MKNKPLVNITITTLNGEEFLEESIKSLFNQDYKNKEIYLVDAGSKDNTVKIAKEYDLTIFYKEGYMSSGWNYGANKTKAKYFIPWSRDDIMIPENRITRQVEIMENNKDLALIYGKVRRINSEGNDRGTKTPTPKEKLPKEGGSLGTFASWLLRMKAFKEIMFDSDYKWILDWDLAFRLYRSKWKIKYYPEVYGKYRRHKGAGDKKITEEEKKKEKNLMFKKWKEEGLI